MLGRISRAILVFAMVSAVMIVSPQAAWAGCPGSSYHLAVGAFGGNSNIVAFGNKSNLWVNNFDSHQVHTWRAVGVFRNVNNFAEVGFFTEEGVDQQAHPYRTWFSDGVPHEDDYNATNIAPRNTYYYFNVQDKNDDHMWSFGFGGNPLGADKLVNMDGTQAEALIQAESFCTTDSLWAHFKELQFIRDANGPWRDYGTLGLDVDNSPTYDGCITSGVTTSFYVKQNC